MKTVLVVDNEPFNVDLVKTILQKAGFRVKSVDSGDKAIKAVKRDPPDLVLMDLQLPGMDGLETTRRMLAEPKSAGVKVVAFSALAMPQDRKEALQAGCVGYITKPIGAKDLIAAVRGYVGA